VDQITFTSANSSVPASLVNSNVDFETLNEQYGPQGGVTEVSLSMTAVGDAGQNKGLFIREQRPADGDPTQGGTERVLNSDITSIQFQFFDGTNWIDTWDTRQGQGQRRIPAAIKVTYQLDGDETDHTMIIQCPLSDVTSLNPVQTETAQ
jgi:hypothetical protein